MASWIAELDRLIEKLKKYEYVTEAEVVVSYLILPLPSGRSPVSLASCVSELTCVEAPDEANPLWCSRLNNIHWLVSSAISAAFMVAIIPLLFGDR
jgi:hypothetical protein